MREGLSAQELAFISDTDDPVLARACVAFGFACNHLDTFQIEDRLSPDVFYGSQNRMEEVHGKAMLRKRFPKRHMSRWGMHDDALVEYAREQIERLEALL